jgi:hypothetical protein
LCEFFSGREAGVCGEEEHAEKDEEDKGQDEGEDEGYEKEGHAKEKAEEDEVLAVDGGHEGGYEDDEGGHWEGSEEGGSVYERRGRSGTMGRTLSRKADVVNSICTKRLIRLQIFFGIRKY